MEFNVLIVDDDTSCQTVIERWVSAMGHFCRTADDGHQAVEMLGSHSYDLVITDMVMPNMDGLQLLKHIKSHNPETSVILLTGYSQEYSYTDLIKAGASDFIEKPTTKNLIEAKVNRIFQEKTLQSSYYDELKTQQVLLDLLNLSIESKQIDELLHDFLVCITSFPWLDLEPQGALFLISEKDENLLELKAHHNLAKPLVTICAEVKFGYCICGKAAASREIVFVDHLDKDHDNLFEGIHDHGHYCVPIILNDDKLLGVFTLYTKAGTARNEKVVTVLKAASHTLARIINHKQAEATIIQQEQNFRSMTDSVLDAIIMMDNRGLISFWNPAAQRIFGYSSEEAIGMNLHKMIAPARYQDQYQPKLDSFFASGQGDTIGRTIEINAIKKDGKELPVELSISALKVKGEWQSVGIVRDISARKSLEEEKEKLNQQLRQAHKMEAIGTLAGGIAHDFNNILGAIIGFADMAMDDLEPGSQVYKDLERILAAGNRAKDLVSQILTFSRQKEEQFSSVKIQFILKETLKLLRASIPANIEIKQNIDTDCHSVLADPTQIHQVIMNLCTNAYYAMHQNGGVLDIGLKEIVVEPNNSPENIELESGRYINLSVSDTGVGMNREVISRLFEPFYTTKPAGEASGMGLSLVHGIITELGGHINVKSQPGQGSTFDVYFPAVADNDKATRFVVDSILEGNEHVLLVDDELPLIEVVSRVLKKWGYKVTSRTSSVEALEAFKAHPDEYDLVITDLAMPNMTGLNLAHEMLKLNRDIPIILCTGFSESNTIEHAEKIGVKRILTKPLSPQEVIKVIREIL